MRTDSAYLLEVTLGIFGWFRPSARRTRVATRRTTDGSFYGRNATRDGDLVVAGGRSHVANAPYLLPKDIQEGARLDFQHFMLRYALKGNYAAPLTSPHGILDIGTGTGRWAVEMAMLFPEANVIGVDLVTPPPDASHRAGELRPANYAFVQANVLEGLPFGDRSFDFVHSRLLVFGIPTARWPEMYREAYRLLQPGGWMESVEADAYPENGGPDMDIIGRWVVEISRRRGIDVFAVRGNGDMLRQAGFANVRTHDVLLPGGTMGGRTGQLVASDYFAVVGGLRGAMVAQGITSAEEFDRVLAQAKKSIDRYPCRFHFPIAMGQKLA